MLKSKFFKLLPILLILFIATLNHFITFMAYDWYDGIDGYSYNVSGLQLVTGRIFDLFPILYRPPFIPIVKNLLYLIFEGHPYGLIILIHSIGILTALLVYLLGCKFHKAVGFIAGLLFASSIQISVNFHHISTFTFFVPLLLLAANLFVTWAKNNNVRSLIWLIIATSLCFLTRLEAIILIPIFAFFGFFIHRNIKHCLVFLSACVIILNFFCLLYYLNFGYWGITHNTGWSLFTRISRAQDSQFNPNNGPFSKKVYNYMSQEWPKRVKSVDFYRFQMFSFSLAQKELGYLDADKLFLKASIEAISSDPLKFMKFTFLRVLGQLDLYISPGLNHKEFLGGAYETDSGHMWGFEEKRMQDKNGTFYHWRSVISALESPLKWERQVIKSRLFGLVGKKTKMPELPASFRMVRVFNLDDSGNLQWNICGDSNMSERLWYCRDLDVFFFLKYWGEKTWSRPALKALKIWDGFSPKQKLSINIHRIMWILWIVGLFVSERRRSLSLAAFICIVVAYAFCQAIFSDNYGGRFELYMRTFLWLGSFNGIVTLKNYFREKIRKIKSNEYKSFFKIFRASY
jgi:hypothetical protein